MRILILLPILAGLPALAHESTGNPASQFCVDLEGWLERGQNERGPTTNCVIEEWQLFRAMSKRNLVRPYRCGANVPCMANPASVNCNDIGGELRIMDGKDGQYGLCSVEEWSLFRIFHR